MAAKVAQSLWHTSEQTHKQTVQNESERVWNCETSTIITHSPKSAGTCAQTITRSLAFSLSLSPSVSLSRSVCLSNDWSVCCGRSRKNSTRIFSYQPIQWKQLFGPNACANVNAIETAISPAAAAARMEQHSRRADRFNIEQQQQQQHVIVIVVGAIVSAATNHVHINNNHTNKAVSRVTGRRKYVNWAPLAAAIQLLEECYWWWCERGSSSQRPRI